MGIWEGQNSGHDNHYSFVHYLSLSNTNSSLLIRHCKSNGYTEMHYFGGSVPCITVLELRNSL